MRSTRRTFLRNGLAVGIPVGTTGCLGVVGYQDRYDLRAATIGGGTIEKILQSLSYVVNEISDDIRLHVESTPDDQTTLERFGSGEINAPAITNWTLMSEWNSRESSQDGEPPLQGLGLGVLALHWITTKRSGITTTDDLAGKTVLPFPPGSDLRNLIETIHETEGTWKKLRENAVTNNTENAVDAIADGRIDAFVNYFVNGILPPWGRELDQRVDLIAPEPSERWKRAVREVPGPILVDTTDHVLDRQSSSDVTLVSHDTRPYTQDVGPAEIPTCRIGVQLLFGGTVPDEVVFELANISHQYADRLRNRTDGYPNHTRPARTRTTAKINSSMYDLWTVDAPIHPGMAKFVDEHVSKHG